MSDEEPDRHSSVHDALADSADSLWEKIDPRLYMRALHIRVHALEDRFTTLSDEVKGNTATTNRIKDDTGEIVEVFRAWKGALRVVDFLTKIAKPIIILGVAITILAGGWAYIMAHMPQ